MFLQTLVFQTFKIDQQIPKIYSQQYLFAIVVCAYSNLWRTRRFIHNRHSFL